MKEIIVADKSNDGNTTTPPQQRRICSTWREPMKIPNSDRAIIDPSKLTEYLLNTEHERGGAKAKLLLYFGYSPENWQQLESDIRKFHLDADVNIIKETAYGVRYEVSANLLTPVNRKLLVKTV